MDTPQILGWVNSALLGVIGFLCKSIWDDVKEMKQDIKARTLKGDCVKTHEDIDRMLHHHGSLGQAGEVIPK